MKQITLILSIAFFAPFFTYAQTYITTSNISYTESKITAGDSRVDSGGGFMGAGAGRYIQFSTDKSVKINQVEINANITGEMTVQLLDVNDTVLDSKTITLTESGIQNIDLGFIVPEGRGYKLNATEFSEGLKLYRNNLHVSYPYSSGPIDVIDSHTGYAFYYFFYNWDVKSHAITTDNNTSITSL